MVSYFFYLLWFGLVLVSSLVVVGVDVGPVVLQVLEVLQLVRCYSWSCWSDVIVVAVGQLLEL